MPTEIVLALSGFGFLSVFTFFFGLHSILTSQTQTIESRLDRYAKRMVSQESASPAKDKESGVFEGMNRAISSGPRSSELATQLARADLKLTPSEFIVLNFASVLIGFLVTLLVTRGNFVLSLLGGLLGFYVPRFYVRYLQSQRLTAFNNQLGDTLLLLANSLRSGYSLLQSMETVAKELPPPMSTEFQRVVREIGLGLTIEEALAHMVERIDSDDLDLVVTAINVQHEVGGNLSEILDTISHTIRERVRIKGQIRAMTATQRLSGNVIAVLPIVLAVYMYVFNPNYLAKLWNNACGILMVIFGMVTILAGFLTIRRITAIEV